MARLVVGLIYGGRSVEHEVSIASARSLVQALDPRRYRLVPIAISRDGNWLRGIAPEQAAQIGLPGAGSARAGHRLPPPARRARRPHRPGPGDLARLLRGVDVVFPLLHGPYGEDGTVQGLLELAGIPYVGAGVSASAVGMDKALMKALFHEQGLPIPEFSVVRRGEWEKDRASRLAFIAAVLGAPPFFVKPSNSGSSIGISRVSTPEALVQAIDQACLYDRKVLVERAIDAREVECSVLGNEDPIASVVGEIVPKGPFYDYASKYTEGGMSLVVPAVLPPELLEQTRELALRAYRAIDCAGMARVDFFVRRTDLALLVNEINTIPGFTAMSVFPKLWEASGLPYPRLVDRLIELALERAADRARSHPTA